MALTSTLGLTQDLFDMIAAELLVKADDDYVYLQSLGPLTGGASWEPGAKTILFNQPDLPTGTYTESSRRLTDATAVDTGAIAITMTQQTLTVREYAGPHDGTAVRGFGITEKIRNLAKHDIVSLIGSFLRRDRNKFVNKRRMDDLLTSTNTQTPDDSAVGVIAAGQAASASMLRKLNKKMKDLLIPRKANGRWTLFISTKDEQEYKADSELRLAFQGTGMGNTPAVTGQVALWENFDIVVDTLMPTAAVGAGSLVTGYQSIAVGPYHLGEAIVMQPSPRMANETDYGRQQKMIWIAEEAVGLLYGGYVVVATTT